MKTFLTTGGVAIPEELGPRSATSDFVNVGDVTSVVRRRWGQGGLGLDWASMTFGMPSRSTGSNLTYVRLDRLRELKGYEGLATKLCAVPLKGFRWRSAAGWTKTEAGWALGFYEEGERSGFLLAVAGDPGSERPVTVDWDAARRWLLSESWDQMKLLHAYAHDFDAPMRDFAHRLRQPAR